MTAMTLTLILAIIGCISSLTAVGFIAWAFHPSHDQETTTVPYMAKPGHRPMRGSEHAAGSDLLSVDGHHIEPGETATVDLGLSAALPDGTFGLMAVRSSTGTRGLVLANQVGIIDNDYRGTIKAKLRNTTTETLTIAKGERVTQLVIVPYITPTWQSANTLDDTERGTGGFGSTGA